MRRRLRRRLTLPRNWNRDEADLRLGLWLLLMVLLGLGCVWITGSVRGCRPLPWPSSATAPR